MKIGENESAIGSRPVWGVTFRPTCLPIRRLAVPGFRISNRTRSRPFSYSFLKMKRFLISFVAILMTSVCVAQDIIVKKDGSTIQAKVLKVTQSEIEYKKISNPTGPSYTISTKELQCINYENGSRDTFVSENFNPGIVTNETATQYSDDKKLLGMVYSMNPKKAKTLKIVSYTVGPALLIGGISLVALGNAWGIDAGSDGLPPFIAGCVISAGGIALSTICYCKARKLENAAFTVHSAPLYQHEFKVGKSSNLMVGVDMLKDNTFKNQTLGLGLSFNF